MRPIAIYHSPFKEKFGLPRQGGLVPIPGEIVFGPDYRNEEAFREICSFSHLWLIWVFSSSGQTWHPTVRPPRMGGNRRVGVFASRSPYRPNPIGLSAVKLVSLDLKGPNGPVLQVSGGDLMDGTPILDIKPYLPLSDCIIEANGSLPTAPSGDLLEVIIPEPLRDKIPPKELPVIESSLRQDPRPAYHEDPARIYSLCYGSMEIKFRVENCVLTVTDIVSVRL